MLRRQIDDTIQPGEIILSLVWLHKRPSELADVDELETEALDVADVALPLLWRPCFGIVVHADRHHLARRKVKIGLGFGDTLPVDAGGEQGP